MKTQQNSANEVLLGEVQPLLTTQNHNMRPSNAAMWVHVRNRPIEKTIFLIFCFTMLGFRWPMFSQKIVLLDALPPMLSSREFVPIEDAVEYFVDIGDEKQVWLRTWGKSPENGGIPILFVHGGPGQAVADYNNGNRRFFDPKKLFVVEVDQRGTGKSRPSVRDSYWNMKSYENVSIAVISQDYELVREFLNIDKWAVWGGSYGSTIAIDYCIRYSKSCTAMLLRGIYLNSKKELDAVYTRNAYVNNEKRKKEFNILYERAKVNAERRNEPRLNPNDAKGLLTEYEAMITQGDKHAMWAWFVFENNLMEDNPDKILQEYNIDLSKIDEAQSVAFFETRLWLHETYEDPSNLLDRVSKLKNVPICQGNYDNVCPVENAQNFVDALNTMQHRHLHARFLAANHEDTDPIMEACLKDSVKSFLEFTF